MSEAAVETPTGKRREARVLLWSLADHFDSDAVKWEAAEMVPEPVRASMANERRRLADSLRSIADLVVDG